MNWVKGYIPLPGFIEAPNRIGGKKKAGSSGGNKGRGVLAGKIGGEYRREGLPRKTGADDYLATVLSII